MKSYTIYVCEICGKESQNFHEIKECEAKHLGLTVDELYLYERMKRTVAYFDKLVSRGKINKADKIYVKAIDKLIAFEKDHNIVKVDGLIKAKYE